MLLDCSLPQCSTIRHLFDNPMLFKLLPGCLEPPRFQILDRCFQAGDLLPLRLEQLDYRTAPDCSRMRSASPRSTDLC